MRSIGHQPPTAGDRPRVADQRDSCVLAALVATAALVIPARGASAQLAAPAASGPHHSPARGAAERLTSPQTRARCAPGAVP
jgi:hypothetical protein